MTDEPDRLDLTELVVAHYRGLYGYAYRLAGSAADAEDLVQQTFLVAQQKLDQIRDASAARSWLFTVLRNNYLKSRQRRVPLGESALEAPLEEVPQHGADESPIDEERLRQLVGELPEEFRLVIAMFYFEELSYKQIAMELELPAGTVMSRLSRAKRHLRSKLLEAGEIELAGSAPRNSDPTAERASD